MQLLEPCHCLPTTVQKSLSPVAGVAGCSNRKGIDLEFVLCRMEAHVDTKQMSVADISDTGDRHASISPSPAPKPHPGVNPFVAPKKGCIYRVQLYLEAWASNFCDRFSWHLFGWLLSPIPRQNLQVRDRHQGHGAEFTKFEQSNWFCLVLNSALLACKPGIPSRPAISFGNPSTK